LARHYMQVMVGNEVMEIPAPAVDITSGTDRFSTSGQYLSGGAYVRRSRFGARHVEVSWNNLNSQDVYLLHKFEEAVIANDNQFMFVDPFGHGNIMPQWLSNHNMKILPGGGFVKGYSLVPVSSMLQHYEVPENTNGHYDFFIPSGYVGYLWADTLYGTLDYTVDDLPVGTGLTLGAGPHQLGVGESGNPTSVTNVFPNPDFVATSGDVVVWENLASDSRGRGDTFHPSNSTEEPLTKNEPVPAPHPFGIETAVKQTSLGNRAALLNVYNISGHYNSSTPSGIEVGGSMWVWLSHSGYQFRESSGWKPYSPEIDPNDLPHELWFQVRTVGVEDLADPFLFTIQAISGNADPSHAGYATGVVFTPGRIPLEGEFFDETFSPDPDLWAEPRPGGGAQLVGKPVEGLTAYSGVVVQSSQWAKTAGASARLIKNSDGGNTYMQRSGAAAAQTAKVWRYQSTEIGNHQPINFGTIYFTGGGVTDRSNQAPNAEGETLIEVNRDASTGSALVLYGGQDLGESIWFDLLTITETENYDGPPFSGATTYAPVASATWTGVPDNSPSVLTLHGGGLGGVWCKLVPQGQNPAPLEKLPGRGVSELSFTGEGIDIVQHSAALDLQTAAATWLETGWWK